MFYAQQVCSWTPILTPLDKEQFQTQSKTSPLHKFSTERVNNWSFQLENLLRDVKLSSAQSISLTVYEYMNKFIYSMLKGFCLS